MSSKEGRKQASKTKTRNSINYSSLSEKLKSSSLPDSTGLYLIPLRFQRAFRLLPKENILHKLIRQPKADAANIMNIIM